MQQLIFQQIKNELVNGSVKKGHPFKYFAFGTVEDNNPRLRTVVLRKVYPDMTLLFYTDERSKKVAQIQNENRVCALFYHPKKLIQVQIEGLAHIQENPEMLRRIWQNIPPSSKKDYTSVFPPGLPINGHENVEYLSDQHHFCMIEIIPQRIEYLRLKRPNHIRLEFIKKDNDWKGNFLVP